jgi:hypothetical protein
MGGGYLSLWPRKYSTVEGNYGYIKEYYLLKGHFDQGEIDGEKEMDDGERAWRY